MDSSHAILSGVAFLAGWWFKGATIVKEDPVPCRCHCNCQVEGLPKDSENWWPSAGILVGIVFGLIGLLANVALAFRITVTNKGEQHELAFVVSQQKGSGKSKGVLGATRALQITG